MAFADLVRYQKSQGKGVIGSLSGAVGQATLQKIDPRNYLFNRRGTLATLFPGLKGYQAKTSSEKISSGGSGGFSSGQVDLITDKLDRLSIQMEMTSKNSMSLPMMARDMNVMRQNIVKMAKAQGIKPATKADTFFMKASDREKAYEAQFGRKSTSPTPTKTLKEQPSILSTLITTVGSVLASGLSSLGGVISSAIETLGKIISESIRLLGTVLLGKSLAGSIPDVDLPDRGKPGGSKGGQKPAPSGTGKGAGPRKLFGFGSKLSVGAGLALYSPELGDGTLEGAALRELSEENRIKYKQMIESGDKSGASNFLRQSSPKYFGNNNSPTPDNSELGGDFDYKKYTDLVAKQESGSKGYTADNGFGFVGKYQFGAKALETYGYLKPGSSSDDRAVYYPRNWTGKDGIKNKEDFMNSAAIQEKLMQEYTQQHIKQLKKSGVLQENMAGVDVASRLYAAHHGGVGGANALFLRGESRGDRFLSAANTGKSAATMASLYSGGSAPSGSTIGKTSVAIASANSPSTPPPVVIDNKSTYNNTQMASNSGGGNPSAFDSDLAKLLLSPMSL
jgi:hypothetical protein